MEKKNILIGLSWVYANGRLHIGHVGSSLPADALARFHRLIGNDVSFVTGSDCYGTPILVSAMKEGVEPEVLAEKYHTLLKRDFERLLFTFDNYSKTLSAHHNEFARNFHAEMYQGGYVYEKTASQLFCEECGKYLPDRYVEGLCPHCKQPAKGDSCDHCGKILEPEELLEPKCKLCGHTPVPRMTKQLYLKLSELQPFVEKHFEAVREAWTANAQGLAGRYLNEGLVDRAITRNISWGVRVPSKCDVPNSVDCPKRGNCILHNIWKNKSEWEEKRVYIWAENVLGYLAATVEFCEKTGRDWRGFLLDNAVPKTSYYVHAKDNIPFHALILPGLMLANDAGRGAETWHKPDVIVASEYITLEGGRKMSKSAGGLLTAEELSDYFDVDLIRYYFLRSINDRKDTTFSIAEFVTIVNGELINNFGNLVNRVLAFVKSKFAGEVKVFNVDLAVRKEIEKTYKDVIELMVAGKVNKAVLRAFELVNFGNKYFDECAPWVSVKNDVELCRRNIFECVTIIANVAKICEAFIPSSCGKVQTWLSVPRDRLEYFVHRANFTLPEIEILFKRLDPKEVLEHFAKYK